MALNFCKRWHFSLAVEAEAFRNYSSVILNYVKCKNNIPNSSREIIHVRKQWMEYTYAIHCEHIEFNQREKIFIFTNNKTNDMARHSVFFHLPFSRLIFILWARAFENISWMCASSLICFVYIVVSQFAPFHLPLSVCLSASSIRTYRRVRHLCCCYSTQRVAMAAKSTRLSPSSWLRVVFTCKQCDVSSLSVG